MDFGKHRQWFSWAAVAVLAISCCVLGILQYRSIEEIAQAERSRLLQELQAKLAGAARTFNEDIAGDASALIPTAARIEAVGAQNAYEERYSAWRKSHGQLFARIALAIPHDGQLTFLLLDHGTETFGPADWPANWESMRDDLTQRARRGGGPARSDGVIFEIPRFGSMGDGIEEREWLLFELNTHYIEAAVLPKIIERYINQNEYDVAVVNSADPSMVIFQSTADAAERIGTQPEASISLLSEIRTASPARGGRGGPPPDGGPPPPFGRPGRWRMMVRGRAGSIGALVRQTQRRNLMITASILLLIVATVSLLIRFSRQAQKLAELQISFVTSVSHELRTPLTVIRTAAYNLRGPRIRSVPEQVERYGRLIEKESERLEGMVEDVLRFASAKAGHVIRDREPVAMNSLVEKALESRRASIENTGVRLEEHIDAAMPIVFADSLALRHALQNLIDNAIKYGAEGGNWIGIYANGVVDDEGSAAVVRVADHGPGIPSDELSRLFDPFFRGRRAIQDQVHGTGLGLDLAKRIIEAHGGSIAVKSDQPGGSEFTVRIPAAPAEYQAKPQNESANSIS